MLSFHALNEIITYFYHLYIFNHLYPSIDSKALQIAETYSPLCMQLTDLHDNSRNIFELQNDISIISIKEINLVLSANLCMCTSYNMLDLQYHIYDIIMLD